MAHTLLALLLVVLTPPAQPHVRSLDDHGIDAAQVTSVRHLVGRTIETRDVEHFEGIRIEGIADVYLSQDATQLVQVDAEEGTAQLVTTSVVDGTLVIQTDKRLHSGKPIKLYVTVPTINALSIQGTGNIIGMTPLECSQLTLATAGTGNIQLDVTAKRVETSIQGTGNVNLSGTAQSSIVTCSGTGDYHGNKLKAEAVIVTASGTGNVEVNASQSLSVQLSGIGDVQYAGNVKNVTSTISGLGSIRKLGK